LRTQVVVELHRLPEALGRSTHRLNHRRCGIDRATATRLHHRQAETGRESTDSTYESSARSRNGRSRWGWCGWGGGVGGGRGGGGEGGGRDRRPLGLHHDVGRRRDRSYPGHTPIRRLGVGTRVSFKRQRGVVNHEPSAGYSILVGDSRTGCRTSCTAKGWIPYGSPTGLATTSPTPPPVSGSRRVEDRGSASTNGFGDGRRRTESGCHVHDRADQQAAAEPQRAISRSLLVSRVRDDVARRTQRLFLSFGNVLLLRESLPLSYHWRPSRRHRECANANTTHGPRSERRAIEKYGSTRVLVRTRTRRARTVPKRAGTYPRATIDIAPVAIRVRWTNVTDCSYS